MVFTLVGMREGQHGRSHNIEIDVAYTRDIQLLDTHSQELKPT